MEELQHILSYDSKGKQMVGGKRYKLRLPPNIPVPDFWSIIVYDSLSRLIINTDQPWPSVFRGKENLVYNTDGSVDAWFGPELVKGQENNWVKTIPGKNWILILRLYDPLEAWFSKKWRPGEIEELISVNYE